jgi:uncharacterized protein YndB with AHSA1/START domain
VIHVSETGVLPVGLDEGFRYVTDPANWPEYWPGVVVVDASRWAEPGDVATVTMRLLRRPVELRLELDELRPPELVAYRSRQSGLPDARHERRFANEGGRLRYTLTTEFEPRSGLQGLYDRLLVARGVRRALRATLARLDEIFTRAG